MGGGEREIINKEEDEEFIWNLRGSWQFLVVEEEFIRNLCRSRDVYGGLCIRIIFLKAQL